MAADCKTRTEAYPSDGRISLHSAAVSGKVDLVLSVLRTRCLVDERNFYGWTPLMQAARRGHKSIVQLLIQHGADVNATNRYGASCLACATRSGHQATVEALLDAGAEPWGSNEITPIAIAAQLGFNTIVHVLLDRGAEINQSVKIIDLTPLMVAAANGCVSTAQLLVDRGCDVNAVNVRGAAAFDIALSQQLKTLLKHKTITRDSKGDFEILEAAKICDMSKLRDAVQRNNSQLDSADKESGLTALMIATINNRMDFVEFLVRRGADLNKRDTVNGWTALAHAVFNRHKIVARYLLTKGCNAALGDIHGFTAFDIYAALEDECDPSFCKLLAEKTYTIRDYLLKPQIAKYESAAGSKAQNWMDPVTTPARLLRTPCKVQNIVPANMKGKTKTGVPHSLNYGLNRKRTTNSSVNVL